MESTALTRQRETTCHKAKEREQTQTLNFLSVFSCCFVCWFCLDRFASIKRSLFGPHLQNRVRKFSSVRTSSGLVFNHLTLPRHVYLWALSNRVDFLLQPGIGWRTISVYGGSTPAQKNWDLLVFYSLSVNVVTHLWLVDLPVSWPLSLRSADHFRRLYGCSFFFSLSLSLLPQKLASSSLYDLDRP